MASVSTIVTHSNLNYLQFWFSFFDLYSEMVSGMVFFEFTTMYFLLGSTRFLFALNVNYFCYTDHKTMIWNYLFQFFPHPFAGSSLVIQFKTVVIDALAKLFVTAAMANAITYKVSASASSLIEENQFRMLIILIRLILKNWLFFKFRFMTYLIIFTS